MNKNIGISLCYAFSYRNFVETGILERFIAEGAVLHVFLSDDLFLYSQSDSRMRNKSIHLYRLQVPRSASLHNVLYKMLSSRIFALQNTNSYRIKSRALAQISIKKWFEFYFLGKILFSRSMFFFRMIQRLYFFLSNNPAVKEQLRKLELNAFIFSLQHFPVESYYNSACSALSIPTVSIIHSWDVITTKGSFIWDNDLNLVWGEVNRDEYCSHVSKLFSHRGKVKAVGVPQFDHYRLCQSRYYGMKRKDFLDAMNLPWEDSDKIILYSTASGAIFPGESELIQLLINEIESGELYGFKLLVRVHPQANCEDYVNLSFSDNVFVKMPDGYRIGCDSTKISNQMFEDVFLDLCIADVCLNVASTISIDISFFSTPIINIAFDCVEKSQYVSNSRYYLMDHYEKIVKTGGVTLAHSYSELLSLILNLSELPSSESISQLYSYYKDGYCNNIINAIGIELNESCSS